MLYYSVYAHKDNVITHNKFIALKSKSNANALFKQLKASNQDCIVIIEATKREYDGGDAPSI